MKYYFSKSNSHTLTSILRSPEKGFTIIETLVALVIFTTSILAIIVMTPSGISAINLAKNKMTASYLAQEGIDLVRAYRDNGSIAVPHVDTLTDVLSQEGMCGDLTAGCSIDTNLQIINCNDNGVSNCPFLVHDTNGGFIYDQNNTGDRSFKRTIFVLPTSSPDFQVTSRVDWNQGGTQRSVEYKTNLSDWNH